MKAFVSWSGGKDAALSCYRAMRDKDIDVTHLLNMVSEDGKHSRTHGVSSEMLRIQAGAMSLPIVQKRTSWGNYEEGFKKTVAILKEDGIEAGVFGDIDLQQHRDWVERVCAETGIRPIFPLWQAEREALLTEFIDLGFEAFVVSVKADVMGPEWIGRKIDKMYIKELKGLDKVDLCGEAGEYHTLVVSGPIFKQKIDILKSKKINRDKHWFLDILDHEIDEEN
ncbi:MAG: diphthine--ammonia ligase [Candidatus Aadella gelida]|nr:diphthine--ammonia ligase [Candidatus Aadella gelida]